MTEPANQMSGQPYATADQGKVPAFIVYAIYVAAVFHASLLSPVGVIIAYVVRAEASPWVRSHLDQQIKMFWAVFWWVLGLCTIGVLLCLTIVGAVIGIPLIVVTLIGSTIWFVIKSVFGLLKLINGQPA